MSETFHAVGLNRTVEFDGETVVLSGMSTSGEVRTSIPVERIASVDFDAPGKGLTPGIIRFRVPGEVNAVIGQDKNSAMFPKRKAKVFAELRDSVEQALSRSPRPEFEPADLEPRQIEVSAAPEREDINRAMSHIGVTFGVGRLVKELPRLLRHDESVSLLVNGANGDGPALVALTSQRVVVMYKAKMLFTHTDSFEFASISNIEFQAKIATGKLRIHAAGVKKPVEVKNVPRVDAERIIQAVRSGGTPSTTQRVGESIADRLLQLKELHAAGVLTDEQYAEKSAPLIDAL